MLSTNPVDKFVNYSPQLLIGGVTLGIPFDCSKDKQYARRDRQSKLIYVNTMVARSVFSANF
jgi:hypothetical protein